MQNVNMLNKEVNIIGGGLAGSEAALFLANHNVKVKLYEMKRIMKNPAQKMEGFAELVCSNSLKSSEPLSASGMLKIELEKLGCSLLECAKKCSVPSGNALSVNREKFSCMITKMMQDNKNIEIIDRVVEEIDITKPTIISAGPLCDEKLFKNLSSLIGDDNCYFYDAIAPIVSADSIDYTRAFWGNRYEKGETKDYLNAWLTKDEYNIFVNELINAKTVELHSFEKLKVFEGCMPVEILAKRGERSLRYGPMKPVGLSKQVVGEKPMAIIQLRKEDENGTMLNLVGFQTNLLFGEQKRVFSLIPALKNAEFLRYGTMHRNSYINAPKSLNKFSQLKNYPNVFIAGQISGVEGYVESIASGLYTAVNMLLYINNQELLSLPSSTCIGALYNYIATSNPINFQPMNANYGIISIDKSFEDKQEKKQYMLDKSKMEIDKFMEVLNGRLI